MIDSSDPKQWATRLARIACVGTLAALAIGLVWIAAVAAWTMAELGELHLGWLTFAVLGAVGAVLVGAWALVTYALVRLAMANIQSVEYASGRLDRMEVLLESQSDDLRTMANLASLSDQAKSLIYHEREVDAIREVANAMLMRQDYESAESIIHQMEERMGMADEARRLRGAIEKARRASVDEKIDVAVEHIDEICENGDWPRARREAERLIELFPDNPKIRALPRRIEGNRNSYKGKLLRDYGEAHHVNDVERSIELLQELDKYLTPQEAAALAESARDTFKKKLHNLGVQFAIAVADMQWSNALATGDQIIQEFPNSRMAREVQEKYDLLKAYASGARQPAPMDVAEPAAKPQQT